VLVDGQLRIHDRWNFDCFNVIGHPYREASDAGLPLIWRQDAGPEAAGVLVKECADIKSIRWPDPWDGPLMSDRLKAIQRFQEQRPDVAVLGWVEGCFAQAATFRGMERAMMDLALTPDFLRELMDFILPHEIAFAQAQIQAGASLIGVGDAAASLVHRDSYVQFILPYERELIRAIRRQGVPAKLHICGDIKHLLADIAGAGADMVDIDWMIDLKDARRTFGPQVCLCGNFDPVAALLRSTPEKVRQSCLRCIRESGAPFVLSPGCEVPPDTPAENFAALCEVYEM
jgi:uroporphyrinogen decarboxylase